MGKSFGERLEQFVLSVDVMDAETFDDLMKLIASYLKTDVDITYCAILEEQRIDNARGLRTCWSTREAKPSYTVDSEGEGYSGHTAFCYGENKSLWIVGADRTTLDEAEKYKDLWSQTEALPRYGSLTGTPVRTSIMAPLTQDGRPFGIVEFATARYVEPTPAALREAERLAGLVARSYKMKTASDAQRANTRRALQMLVESRSLETWASLAIPKLFLAYSSRADKVVITAINEVLQRYEAQFEKISWEESYETGNINEQVIGNISASEFGLCYLSEPAEEGGEHPFADNANVLFEAGMMQALTKAPEAQPRGWIPIREFNSGSIPFDVAAERSILIERNEEGAFDVPSFTKRLEAQLNALLENHR